MPKLAEIIASTAREITENSNTNFDCADEITSAIKLEEKDREKIPGIKVAKLPMKSFCFVFKRIQIEKHWNFGLRFLTQQIQRFTRNLSRDLLTKLFSHPDFYESRIFKI